MRAAVLCCVFALATLLPLVGAPAQAASIAPIAYEGEAAPGTTGASFSSIFVPNSNDAGDVVFGARFSGPGGSGRGYFRTLPSGGTELIARDGDAAPGLPGMTLDLDLDSRFSSLGDAAINPSGDVVFTSSVAGAGVSFNNNGAAFRVAPSGATDLIYREGDAAIPTLPGVPVFDPHQTSRPVALGTGGEAAFGGDLFNTLASIVRQEPGGPLELTATEGGIITNFGSPTVDDNGNILVRASTTQGGQALRFTSSSTDVLAEAGQAVPSLGAGVTIASLGAQFDDSGAFALGAVLAGPGIDATNNGAILFSDGGGLNVLLREGDPAPGILGGVFDQVTHQHVSAAGTAGLQGVTVGGQSESVIYGHGSDGSTALVRVGDSVPQLSGSVILGLSAGVLDFNDQGDVLFQPSVQQGAAFRQTLVVMRADGSLHVAAFTQQQVEVLPGVFRAIDDFYGASLDANGNVLTGLEFTDGTEGIFQIDPFTPLMAGVELPAAATWCALLAVLLFRTRLHRTAATG